MLYIKPYLISGITADVFWTFIGRCAGGTIQIKHFPTHTERSHIVRLCSGQLETLIILFSCGRPIDPLYIYIKLKLNTSEMLICDLCSSQTHPITQMRTHSRAFPYTPLLNRTNRILWFWSQASAD